MWQQHPMSMKAATVRLDALVNDVVQHHHGRVVKPRGEGDSHFCVFTHPSHAVFAGAGLMRAVGDEPWTDGLPIRVRAAVHIAEVDLHEGDYYGVGVNQTARLRALAHGGQLLASRTVVDVAGHLLSETVTLRSLGTHRVRDFPGRQEVFQACTAEGEARFPALQAPDMSVPPLAATAIIDIVGATAELSTLSHEELVTKHERWDQSLHACFDSHNGRYLKLVGDGCLPLFDTPATAVGFATACKRALADAGATVICGIHFGPVELVGDDVVGQSPMLSHALLRCAKPGQIVVSPIANELVRATGIELESVGVHPIAGHNLSWQLFVAT